MTTAAQCDTLERVKIEKPKRFKVVFHNDNVTTFDFVILLLEHVFYYDRINAEEFAKLVDNKGFGIAGVFSKEIAYEKKLHCDEISAKNDQTLKITVEPE